MQPAAIRGLTSGFAAHYQAATNPQTRLLHRDISGGNILIYPKVKRDNDGTKCTIVWTGLLVDWELSKPVDDDQAPSKASQAERMVCILYRTALIDTYRRL